MKEFFANVLVFNAICTLVLTIWQSSRLKTKKLEDVVHLIFSLSSFVWSFGFGMMIIQNNVEKAYFWRSFAIYGTVTFMITVQALIGSIAQLKIRTRIVLDAIAFLGYIPYFLSIQRNQVVFFESRFGMTYQFVPGIVSNLYTGYFLLVSANILGVIIYMIRHPRLKRIRTFGKYFLMVAILVLGGTVLDMIFPALGLPAVPGSNITQFWGFLLLSYAMDIVNQNRISVSNMAGYIYSSMSAPVMVYDSNHELKIENEAADYFFKIDKANEDKEKLKLTALFDLPGVDVLQTAETHLVYDCTCTRNQVPCYLEINRISDKYGDAIGYIVTVTDVSEREKYIEELEEARKAADFSNQAKSKFLANMSHEIRTPMNAIIGFSELALRETDANLAKEYIHDIKSSSHNLMLLINDILDISKIESGKMELVNVEYDVAAMLATVYRTISNQARGKGLEFRFDIDESVPARLLGDANRVQSVLINLLNNGVKYTKEGFVGLALSCQKKEGKYFLEAKVSDSGIGIREKDAARLFDSFAQVDQSTNYGIEGTGLGLSLVKGFCELMNGSIRVESEYGKGSVFIAIMEQIVVDATPVQMQASGFGEDKDDFSLGKMRVKNLHVLLVDDNEINRKVISTSLRYYGMEVDLAASGAESIKMCQSTVYDFVFMDQMMPEMDGITAMRHIRDVKEEYAVGGTSRIIVVTANAIAGTREQLLSQGFDGYVSKPVEYAQLEGLLKKLLPADKIYYEELDEQRKAGNQGAKALMAEQLPEVDYETGMAHCGGTEDAYFEVLKMMCEGCADSVEELGTARASDDFENYAIYAHAMKGVCLSVGANALGEAARELEMAGKEKNKQCIEDNTESFVETYCSFVTRLGNFLVAAGFATEEEMMKVQGAAQEMDEKEARTLIIDKIHGYVEDFDFAGLTSWLAKERRKDYSEDLLQMLDEATAYTQDMDLDKLGELTKR